MSLEPERGGEDVVVGTVATTEEEVFLGSTLEHGVDVADLDDGLKRLARVAPLLGGRRGLVPLPDQHAAEALTVDRGPPSRRRNEVAGVAATPAWRGGP